MTKHQLAMHGGPKAVTLDPGDVFQWPVITEEHERAVLDVLRRGAMSAWDVTETFEREIAEWHGVPYALAHNNGTASLHAAMYGCGVGVGDEIISPSITIWASCLPAFSLGATMVFADLDPDILCLDPNDIEHRITDRTKAIVVVHYSGMPCDMDAIMAVAERHGVKVIEDVSHAQGGRYKGRLLGTIGHAAGMSIMSGKSLAGGEGGVLLTRDKAIYERAVAFGHYERTERVLARTPLERFAGVPLGGYKYRMHQLTSAVARVELAHYNERMAEIEDALQLFWDCLEGAPGLRARRLPRDGDSTMGGWFRPFGFYDAGALGGLPASRFTEAVVAEGCENVGRINFPLHLHPAFNDCDIYGHGKPTRIANASRDVRQGPGSLPITEAAAERVVGVPYFRRYRVEYVKQCAAAFRKVAENFEELL